MSCSISDCTNPPIPRGKYCEIHRSSKKICVEPNCKKTSRGKTDKCVEHGGGARCVVADCKKSARGKFDKCVEHGGGARCVEPNCKKSSRGKSDKCVEHGGGARCLEPGCKKSTVGKCNKCVVHGGGKRCVEPNCKKGAAGKTDKCKAHGGGSRCVEPNCKKSAVRKSDKCVEHGGGARCVEPNCKKSSAGKSDKCKAHGGGARCPYCIDWIDSRSGSLKYDGYCATCFKRLFPNEPRSTIIHEHTKEIRVRNAITEASQTNELFQGFVHDHPLYTGNCECTHRRRIDHRKLIGNTILAVETDEHAHQGYDEKDEEIRYDDLYMIHSGKWVYIRFNPDITRTQKTDIDDRIDVLLEEMEVQIRRIMLEENHELVEIIKLFY